MTQLASHTEKALFQLIAEGDELAFEELFNRYVPLLNRIIYQVVQSQAPVKDIAQEVFLYLWLGRDKLPSIEEPRHWIFRIAYNQSFRYLRKQLLQQKLQAGMEAVQANTFETTETSGLPELNRLIQKAVDQLPEQSRRIFRMSRTEGMKPAEIATALGISVQGVRNSLTRSAKSIREHLEQNGFPIPLVILLFSLS